MTGNICKRASAPYLLKQILSVLQLGQTPPQRWASVYDAGPALGRRLMSVLCFYLFLVD